MFVIEPVKILTRGRTRNWLMALFTDWVWVSLWAVTVMMLTVPGISLDATEKCPVTVPVSLNFRNILQVERTGDTYSYFPFFKTELKTRRHITPPRLSRIPHLFGVMLVRKPLSSVPVILK